MYYSRVPYWQTFRLSPVFPGAMMLWIALYHMIVCIYRKEIPKMELLQPQVECICHFAWRCHIAPPRSEHFPAPTATNSLVYVCGSDRWSSSLSSWSPLSHFEWCWLEWAIHSNRKIPVPGCMYIHFKDGNLFVLLSSIPSNTSKLWFLIN